MQKRLGSHPDNPNPARSYDEAMHFSTHRAVCPKCGKQGGHKYDAHASLIRMTSDGKSQCFDAHCVKCGKCGTLIPVFHVAFGGWAEGLIELGLVAEFCAPGAGWSVVTSSGQRPDLWIPSGVLSPAIMAGDRQARGKRSIHLYYRIHSAFKAIWRLIAARGQQLGNHPNRVQSAIAGPIVISSYDGGENIKGENGCGHTQYILIGPSVEKILIEIPKIPPLMSALRQEGNCVVCTKPLRRVVVAIDGKVAEMSLRNLVHGFPCDVVTVAPGGFRNLIDSFYPHALKAAQTKVIYMPSTGG